MATYLCTGATGTLGTALTLKLLSQGEKVRAFARNEHGHEKLEALVPLDQRSRLSNLVGACEDKERLQRAVEGADYVIHAAAMKTVPLCAYNPWQAIQTNIVGTRNVVEACLDAGTVRKAVLISSDKARAASTHYGGTKFCAEWMWLCANRYRGGGGGLFVGTCYGNVFNSEGSVLRAFIQQAQYGYLKLTDKRSTRFHITLEQAVNFVLETLHNAEPGTLWIPRLESYRLPDLADAFAKVYNLSRPHVYTGLRPSEKVHESLVTEDESNSVALEDEQKFVLEHGKVHNKGGWSFTSASARSRKLSVDELEALIREAIA